MEYTGKDLLLSIDGVVIARRGEPGSPQAGTWISLEPGYTVTDDAAAKEIVVTFRDVVTH